MSAHKLLIIANNCLSYHNSNGRSLMNLLGKYDKEDISQIYISGELADESCCGHSLRITNGDVVRSYIGKQPVSENGKNIVVANNSGSQISSVGKKTAFTMLLRDLAWDNSYLLKKCILNWSKEQKPDVVILQLGDSSLLIEMGIFVSKKLNIPIITYNTEDYYFKKYDYMRRSSGMGFMYRLFHARYCKKFNKMMNLKPTSIYNCEGLKKIYDDEFKTTSFVIYGATDFKTVSEEFGLKTTILYAGNLGVGRHKSLIEIGEVLQNIDKELVIDVFGSGTEEVERELKAAPGVRFNGLVSYEEVCEKMKHSRLLVHVEGFDLFTKMDAKYAFSTKLADYIKSGIPMLLYAPSTGEGVAYMKKNGAAFFSESKDSLQSVLEQALTNERLRKQVTKDALMLANKNHDINHNSQYFYEIVERAIAVR